MSKQRADKRSAIGHLWLRHAAPMRMAAVLLSTPARARRFHQAKTVDTFRLCRITAATVFRGGTIFFTVKLAKRGSDLLARAIETLGAYETKRSLAWEIARKDGGRRFAYPP
jgi:hypothetical protein